MIQYSAPEAQDLMISVASVVKLVSVGCVLNRNTTNQKVAVVLVLLIICLLMMVHRCMAPLYVPSLVDSSGAFFVYTPNY